MKALIFVLTLLAVSPVAHAAKGSAGLVLSIPEIVGVYGSFWPTENVSLDGRFTLSTLDFGATAHIPIVDYGADSVRHDLLITAMGGWVHDLVGNKNWTLHGGRVIGAVGYGLQAGWDLRLLAGVTANNAPVGWAVGFTGIAMVGHSF